MSETPTPRCDEQYAATKAVVSDVDNPAAIAFLQLARTLERELAEAESALASAYEECEKVCEKQAEWHDEQCVRFSEDDAPESDAQAKAHSCMAKACRERAQAIRNLPGRKA